MSQSFREKAGDLLETFSKGVRALDDWVDLWRLVPLLLLLVMCVVYWLILRGEILELDQDLTYLVSLLHE